MFPAISPTPVDAQFMISAGSPERDGGAVRAGKGGVGAGTGGFEAIFLATADAMRNGAAKTQAMPHASGEAGSDAAMSEFGGSVEELTVRDEAQDEVDGAQDLPEAENSAGDVAAGIGEPERSPDQPVAGDGKVIDGEYEEVADEKGPSIDRGSAADWIGVTSREAASGFVAHQSHEQVRQDVPQQGRQVREAGRDSSPERQGPQRSSTESREPVGAAQVVRRGREESRAANEPLQTRPELANARQPVEPHHRAQSQANQSNHREETQDGSGRSDREPARRDQPLPRERSAPLPPAAARAEQVDTAVRLEQATGRQPSGEAPRANAAPPDQPPPQTQPTSPAQPAPPSTEPAARIGAMVDLQPLTQQPTNAPSQATTAVHDAARAEETPITSRIVRGLTAMVNQRGGSLTMRLDPPELGSLRVQMTINRGTVIAQLTASSPQAHGLLEKNLAMLRTALESHGLSVERLTVQLTAPSNNGSLQQQHQQQDGSGRSAQQDAHADAGEGESRGRREQEQEARNRRADQEGAERASFERFIHEEAVSTGATSR